MTPSYLEVNGVRLAVWETPGSDPTVLFCHATGFHARCWNEVMARIPGRRRLAFDARGHGLSSKPDPPYRWRDFGRDVAAVARALGLKGATAVGHSMGGHAVAYAASLAPEAFSELILIDPVILPPQRYAGLGEELPMVKRRRNEWDSWTDMYQRFKDRPPFQDWNRKVLLDYCEYGLVPAPGGQGFVLACPPEVEASIYQHATDPDSNIYSELAQVEARVTVVRTSRFTPARFDFISSPTSPDLAQRFRHGLDVHYPERSHFLPMEAPDIVADLITHRADAAPATAPHP